MDYEFFTDELLPRIKVASLINFMGGEPTLHPRFTDIFSRTLESLQPFTFLGLFTNGLMPDKVLDLLLKTVGRSGSIERHIQLSILLNWQTMENTTEKNHQRCREVAEAILSANGHGLTDSPPITAIPMGIRLSAPAPSARAMGRIPKIVDSEVISTGRKRATAAS